MQTIHHIALADEWDEAQREHTYATSTLGMSIDAVGYLHASFPEQVRPTLERLYSDVDAPLVLLTLDPEALAEAGLEVRVEPAAPDDPESERFPHVYGGVLPVNAVSSVESLELPGTQA